LRVQWCAYPDFDVINRGSIFAVATLIVLGGVMFAGIGLLVAGIVVPAPG
jgi:hypothetical protein